MKYETRCKQDSIKVAEAYKKLCATDWTDKDWDKYRKVVDKTGMPDEMVQNIANEITKCGGNYRPIDIYQFWG